MELTQINKLIENINSLKFRSVWRKAVQTDAVFLLEKVKEHDNLKDITNNNLEEALLNGVKNWHEFSWGGYGLVYDKDIAKHYCTPSELRKVQYKEGGVKQPNSREQWLDVQSRALFQSSRLIIDELAKL